jgi:uncharacterized DUF497 family protein
VRYDFRWNEWNIDHIGSHGLEPADAEDVVNRPSRGYPREIEREKYLARGQTRNGRYIQAIYVIDPEGTLYVIHARPLTEREKHSIRRRKR